MNVCRDPVAFHRTRSEILELCNVDVFLPRSCCIGRARSCGFLRFPGASVSALAALVSTLADHAGSSAGFVWRVEASPALSDRDWLAGAGELPLVEFDPRSHDDFLSAWDRGDLSVGKYYVPDALIFDPVGKWFIYFQFDFNCGVFAHPDPAFGRAALAASGHDHALTVVEAEATGVIWPDGMHDEAERHAFFRAMEANFER